MQPINRKTTTSWNRPFYYYDVKGSDIKIRTLNIFQRILRSLFGAYNYTIWTQKKIDNLAKINVQLASDLVAKLTVIGKRLKAPIIPPAPRVKDPNAKNIIIVGDKHSGKTTLKHLFRDTFHVTKWGETPSTNVPAFEEIKVSQSTLRILDTPYFENDKLIETVKAKASEVFGGIGFENVDVVIVTFNRHAPNVQNLKEFPNEIPKLFVHTNSEGWLNQQKQFTQNDIESAFKKGYCKDMNVDEEILFSGCIEENELQYKDACEKKLQNVYSLKRKLISKLFTDRMAPFSTKPVEEFMREHFPANGTGQGIPQ